MAGEPDAADALAGRLHARTQLLDAESLRRFSLAIGDAGETGATLRPMRHWAYFLPETPNSGLGPDGHPRSTELIPEPPAPRRMFAGGHTQFLGDLTLGKPVEQRSRVVEVKRRTGSSGELVFVEIEHRLSQDGAERLLERQTLVYREAGAPVAPVAATAANADFTWLPNPVELFRFSAATFNSHRIHYDTEYARGVEHYPDLVVHGPLIAMKLCRGAEAAMPGRRMLEFSFRAAAPLFVHQPVRLACDAGPEACAMTAVRADGVTAMTATARFA